jgi:hypothetical protein
MRKELRETAWIALVALAAQLAFVASAAGFVVLPYWKTGKIDDIPFVDDNFLGPFWCISIALAVALALRQTAFESGRGTWLYAVGTGKIIAAKLAVGAGLYLFCGALAILAYAAWAATPGTHASPFFWSMTAEAWVPWALIVVVYLAAFLAGIRPARWFGTRLLPLAAGGLLALLPPLASSFRPWLGFVVFPLLTACLIGLIHFVARSRDFS